MTEDCPPPGELVTVDRAQAWRMGVLRERRDVQAPGAPGAGMQEGVFSCRSSPVCPFSEVGVQLGAQLGLHVCGFGGALR